LSSASPHLLRLVSRTETSLNTQSLPAERHLRHTACLLPRSRMYGVAPRCGCNLSVLRPSKIRKISSLASYLCLHLELQDYRADCLLLTPPPPSVCLIAPSTTRDYQKLSPVETSICIWSFMFLKILFFFFLFTF